MGHVDDIAASVLDFWFAGTLVSVEAAEIRHGLWFRSNREFDSEIESRFANIVENAYRGLYAEWCYRPRDCLALVVLLDQFPRNIYRDTARAFAYDSKALSICIEALKREYHLQLHLVEALFLVLPLEHAEDADLQNMSVNIAHDLLKASHAGWEIAAERHLEFAIKHREVIRRFGRFPHRNSPLGRKSTPDECTFLSETPSISDPMPVVRATRL